MKVSLKPMSHRDGKNVERGVYKMKSGEVINENKTIKDLGVITEMFRSQNSLMIWYSQVK